MKNICNEHILDPDRISPCNRPERDLDIKVGILLFLLKLIPIASGMSAETFKNMTLVPCYTWPLGKAAFRRHLEAAVDGFSDLCFNEEHIYERLKAGITAADSEDYTLSLT